ncbi:MAG: carbohydrate kinase [Oscillospiraceae bacterium]
MYDVTALGELLIDFTQNGISEQGNPLFEANPGGAPCNVLAMLQKLGHKTAFLGKLGNDYFGRLLKSSVADEGIDTNHLKMDDDALTTLAFVSTGEDGDRSFSFYRVKGADTMLQKSEISEELIKQSRIFHFGTLSMTDEPANSATEHALEIAKREGKIISFDPNLRFPLWKSKERARDRMRFGLSVCDVLKIADDELLWFTGETDEHSAVKKLREEFNIPLVLVSLGKRGSRAYCGKLYAEAPALVTADTIETTGAGDTFCACALHYVLTYGLSGLDEARMLEMLRFANAAASIVTTRRGALRVMPTVAEVERQLETH